MCRAFEETRNEGKIFERIKNIQALMETMKWTAKQAMEALRLSEEEQEKCEKLIMKTSI